MARSPIADTYPPIVRCVVCDAPMRRFDYDAHLRDCVTIETGVAEGIPDRPVERPVIQFEPEPLPRRRR
jgi:hypothetical protein